MLPYALFSLLLICIVWLKCRSCKHFMTLCEQMLQKVRIVLVSTLNQIVVSNTIYQWGIIFMVCCCVSLHQAWKAYIRCTLRNTYVVSQGFGIDLQVRLHKFHRTSIIFTIHFIVTCVFVHNMLTSLPLYFFGLGVITPINISVTTVHVVIF